MQWMRIWDGQTRLIYADRKATGTMRLTEWSSVSRQDKSSVFVTTDVEPGRTTVALCYFRCRYITLAFLFHKSYIKVLFRSKKFLDLDIVALLFLFDKYRPIIK
jgi:hypothetical protein